MSVLLFWRRKWQPTPVFLPGKSHGRRSLVGYSPWGGKESDTTEQLHFHLLFSLFRHTKNLFIIVGILFSLQVRDLSIAYMLVTLTYLYIGVLVFASFPSPPLSKDCIEQVRHCVPCVIVYAFISARQAV